MPLTQDSEGLGPSPTGPACGALGKPETNATGTAAPAPWQECEQRVLGAGGRPCLVLLSLLRRLH